MKKIIAWSIVWCILLTSWTFALEPMLITSEPTLYNDEVPTLYWDNIQDLWIKELIKKYEIVLRNNKLESDYEYNNLHYYTSKMKAEDIIIPDELMAKVKKVYLLVEEWQERMFFAMILWKND